MLDIRQVEGVLVDLLVAGAAEHLLHLGSVFRLHSTVLEDQQGHPPHSTHHLHVDFSSVRAHLYTYTSVLATKFNSI